MSNNLRDRIAAVLDTHYPQTTGYQDELTDWCQCGLPRNHVADAVIAELARSECGGDLCECRQCRVVRILEGDDE